MVSSHKSLYITITRHAVMEDCGMATMHNIPDAHSLYN